MDPARTHPAAATPPSEADARELVLVAAIQRGDSSAWAELLSRYQDRLFGVCFKMVGDRDLAADLAQDSMVKVIEGLGTYDGRAKLSTWIIRVAMNVCLSKLRSEKLRRHASLDALAEGAPPAGRGQAARAARPDRPGTSFQQSREPAAETSVQHAELRRRLSGALLRISPEQRAILVLRDSRGLEYEQIAEVLGVPVGTVKSRLFRARAALREALEVDEAGRPVADRTNPLE